MIRWHNDPAPDAPRWRAEIDGRTVAWAARTGRPGIDNYPWDWYLADDAVPSRPSSGVADSLRSAKMAVANALGAEW